MKQVLMTMFNLSTSAGGITRVMMNRGQMFREVGIQASIATFAWNPGLPATVAQLKEQGRLARDVPVYNLYAYYSARTDQAEASRALAAGAESEHSPRATDTGLCIESSGFAPQETAIRIISDPNTGLKIAEEYDSTHGHCYLIKHFCAADGNLTGITLLEPGTRESAVFPSLTALYSAWLVTLAQHALPCAIIADAPWSAVPVLAAKGTGSALRKRRSASAGSICSRSCKAKSAAMLARVKESLGLRRSDSTFGLAQCGVIVTWATLLALYDTWLCFDRSSGAVSPRALLVFTSFSLGAVLAIAWPVMLVRALLRQRALANLTMRCAVGALDGLLLAFLVCVRASYATVSPTQK